MTAACRPKWFSLLAIGSIVAATLSASPASAAARHARISRAPAHKLNADELLDRAEELRRAGKDEQAFFIYLSLPYVEHLADTVATSDPRRFLSLLRRRGGSLPAFRVKLLEGDLLLALGKRGEALSCYRAVVARIARTPEEESRPGFLPRAYFPLEPGSEHKREDGQRTHRNPYDNGCGAEYDNWLLARFIQLEALPDADREYARMWEVHRFRTHPYWAWEWVYENPDKPERCRFRYDPRGFDWRGREFAEHYAWYLQRRGRPEESLAVLQEVLLRLDLDDERPYQSLLMESITDLPERRGFSMPYTVFSSYGNGVNQETFIQRSLERFTRAGKLTQLQEALQQEAESHPASLRLLGRLAREKGDLDAYSEAEREYIGRSDFDALTTECRLGALEMDLKHYTEALEMDLKHYTEALLRFEHALTLPFNAPEFSRYADRSDFWISAVWRSGLVAPEDVLLRSELFRRITEAYLAMGDQPAAERTLLRQMDQSDVLLAASWLGPEEGPYPFRPTRSHQFRQWCRERLETAALPAARLKLLWELDDYRRVIGELVVLARRRAAGEKVEELEPYSQNPARVDLERWKEAFARYAHDSYPALLEALRRADSTDITTQIQWLRLHETFYGPEQEQLLEAAIKFRYPRSPRTDPFQESRRTVLDPLRNRGEAARLLMQMYELRGVHEKLVEFGFGYLSRAPEGGADFEWYAWPWIDCAAVLRRNLRSEAEWARYRRVIAPIKNPWLKSRLDRLGAPVAPTPEPVLPPTASEAQPKAGG